MTTIGEVMTRLEAAGSEQRRRMYRRHGAGDVQFGVSFADIRALSTSIGRDHDLARALWATGNSDARILACQIAEPARMDDADLDAWLADIDYYVLVEQFAPLAAAVPGVRERAERWIHSTRDWTAQAGWDLVAHLALADPSLPDEYFTEHLRRIEREIGTIAGNRTRHAMNGALIAIGVRSATLTSAAVEAAGRIGIVTVDHGGTGCVTPPAIPYIERTLSHRAAQAAKRAAKAGTRA